MNITVDTQYSASVPVSTEQATTTYRPAAQGTGTVSGSGYTLDIADKVMDNEAYGGHGMTTEEIMQQAANSNAQSKKDFMIVMSSCVSGEDLQKMQEEGFRPGSVDVETYVTIVDRIKVTLAKAGVEVEGYNDNLDLDTIEQIVGSRADAGALVNQLVGKLSDALQKSDMPVTNENIAELVSAVMEASDIGELSGDAIKYLIVNGKAPTIENMYRAQYSSTENVRQSQGYYSEGQGNYGKYYAKKADNINWKNLEGRIDSVVKEAGLDTDAAASAQAAKNARWLVESGIELNADNLIKVTELKNLTLPMGQDAIAGICVTAMENGKAAIEADMRGERSVAEQAHEIAEQVGKISDEAVHDVAESGKEMNIKNLAEAQQQIEKQQASAPTPESQGAKVSSRDNAVMNGEDTAATDSADASGMADAAALKEVQARRQLEEIRLMMTEEANRHLLKAGISVDTTELSKLVEALRAAEDRINAVLFQGADAEENTARALLYEDTLTKTKELAQMPAAVIGKILSKFSRGTLLHIHGAGRELQDQMENGRNPGQNQQGKASEAYETLMTGPRKDLGDRISKAFRNIDDLLTDLGLETSESNRRAVRILGYNRMEINEDNVNAVKEADSQVTGVISRMTPATTLQMIREQKNPLEMTMEELEAYLDAQDSDPVQDAEKYSRFLQRLDRSGSISAEEREAYIGIYRMFRQIEKSDGAVIGSIVATGAQMNFRNMLSAVRTAADKNMDVRVDDGFGGLENLIMKGKAIDAQINAGYRNTADQESGRQDLQEKYYARLSGEINDELAEKTDFAKLDTSDITAETTVEAFADTVKAARASADSGQTKQEKAEGLKSFSNDMHEVAQIDEQVIEALIGYGQSISMDNVQAASTLILERGSLFRQIIRNNAEDTENAQDSGGVDSEAEESAVLGQADSFVENLTDAKQAGVSYKEIISEANKAVEQMLYGGDAAGARIDVKAAKALYKGLSLAGNLAREENYEIPMNIKGEITSVNLKIYHNASKNGKVAVTLDTESLGKVAAEFEVTNERISGMIAYENKAQKNELMQLDAALRQALGSDGGRKVAVSLVHTQAVDLNKFGQDRDAGSAQEQAKVSTGELYQIAKAFLTALKEM